MPTESCGPSYPNEVWPKGSFELDDEPGPEISVVLAVGDAGVILQGRTPDDHPPDVESIAPPAG